MKSRTFFAIHFRNRLAALPSSPIAFGFTSTGKSIALVYELVDDETVYPVTAYEVDFGRHVLGTQMAREVTRRTRDRHLTPEEAAKYRRIRDQIEAEKPEINARLKARLEAASSTGGCGSAKPNHG